MSQLSLPTAAQRSTLFAWLALAGIPGYAWCALSHVCVDGHLYHEEMPTWWLYADFVWVTCFVAAAIAALRSGLRRKLVPFGLLLFLVFSRLLLASRGGGMFVFELPAVIYIAVLALLTIQPFNRQPPNGDAEK
jgi:hypothetical protein